MAIQSKKTLEIRTDNFKGDVQRLLTSDKEELLVVLWQRKDEIGLGITIRDFEGSDTLVQRLQEAFVAWLADQQK